MVIVTPRLHLGTENRDSKSVLHRLAKDPRT